MRTSESHSTFTRTLSPGRTTDSEINAEGLLSAHLGSELGLIFHRHGEPIREFRKAWSTACTKAGVRRLFHHLRRGAVRNMIAAGVPQTVAKRISGHETDSMFDRYAIASETDLRGALRTTQAYCAALQTNVVAMAAKG